MASSVFYKFKSRRDESRVTFDGTGISVFDLKKEIILANNMGKANDFDLYIYDRSTDQEYKNDAEVIPRSSSIIVKRMPAAKPGRGKAAMYVAAIASNGPSTDGTAPSDSHGSTGPNSWHKGAMSKRFDAYKDENSAAPSPPPSSSEGPQDPEAAAMAAMFKAQTANWEETQEKMSQATYIPFTGTRGGRPANANPRPHQQQQQQHRPVSDRPLPSSYVCYRCGQKGHWIQDCPTNNDRDFDHRPRIKRTTGIPRSFLKAVENPTDAQGVMVTPEGGFVVAQPDSASWQRHISRQTKILTESDVRERPPADGALACPIDRKLFRDAMRTPCCARTFCEECVQTHLLERDFVCPGCGKKIPSLDKLEKDGEARRKVKEYIDKAIEDSKKEGEDGDKVAGEAAGPSVAGVSTDGAASTSDPSIGEQVQQQPDDNMAQVIADSVPQLQAQVQQLALMLQNPALPPGVRQQTERQHGQLQLQLGHAQTIALALAAAGPNVGADVHAYQQAGGALGGGVALGMPGGQGGPMGMNMNMNMGMNMGMGGGMGMGMGMPGPQGGFANPAWAAQFQGQQQQQAQDSPYQRLPVNNRRRNLKRERPSDFLEVAGNEGDGKQARYWE